ncbi:hypothetical protein [Myroides odoratimimus]|uniref:hypothetical protein n=1 Tax=Myroides odoratimimus TaxID=76832 RepID=UPI000AF5C631|nr:hypothetical protein [Myroides odoratimimus]
MLFALVVSVFLCLGVIGSFYLFTSDSNGKDETIVFCPLLPLSDSNNDLADTVQAYYLLTSPVIDYVPVEEIPLRNYFKGPNVKFHNQMPSWIT